MRRKSSYFQYIPDPTFRSVSALKSVFNSYVVQMHAMFNGFEAVEKDGKEACMISIVLQNLSVDYFAALK